MKWIQAVGLVFVTASAPAACGFDDEGPTEAVPALVVVQETNLTACMQPQSYQRTVTRSCDGTSVAVQVCADVPLCPAQIDELVAPVERCEEPDGAFHNETTARCP